MNPHTFSQHASDQWCYEESLIGILQAQWNSIIVFLLKISYEHQLITNVVLGRVW
jgi:hypothetical protein